MKKKSLNVNRIMLDALGMPYCKEIECRKKHALRLHLLLWTAGWGRKGVP